MQLYTLHNSEVKLKVMQNSLNEGHLRRLSSVMTIVDSMISRMLNQLNDSDISTPMTVIKGTLSKTERRSLEEGLSELRSLIADFARKYDLDPTKKILRRVLIADASQMWTLLEDCRPARIHGYGSIDSSDEEILEADIRRILIEIDEIIKIFKAGQ